MAMEEEEAAEATEEGTSGEAILAADILAAAMVFTEAGSGVATTAEAIMEGHTTTDPITTMDITTDTMAGPIIITALG
jgi:hypothetical protein